MKKNLTLFFNHFEFGQEHLGKDVFLLPYYLGKKKGYEVNILYPIYSNNLDIPSSFRGVNLIPIENRKIISILPFWKHLNFYLYLLKNARKIDLLMRFHLSGHTYVSTIIYKLLNWKGKVYLKLDINTDSIEQIYNIENLNKKNFIYKISAKLFSSLVTYVSCETKSAFEKIQNNNHFQLQFKNKLILVPNGFDEEYCQSLGIHEKSYNAKENVIITVGRIGSKEKNHEMLLSALEQVDLKDWKVYFIGPIEPEFKITISQFFNKNPSFKNVVIFTGKIVDKKNLWDYYNRSKVFVLTSNKEGYPIVFSEAKRFKNFIVSTNVSSCEDVLEDNTFGISIPLDNSYVLSTTLNQIINNQLNIDVYKVFDTSSISWDNCIKDIKI